ncbi:MAG: histidinol dehydrogenase [Lentisphaerae bacterium]|jgi:histidinol dehydrogenase|nr:histidinol dehydrogenase [Lentisphaerota bacterium]
MPIPIAYWSTRKSSEAIDAFLKRPAFDPDAERAAATVLADIRANGDAAVLAAAKRFDGVDLKPSEMLVTAEQLAEASREVAPPVRRAVREAYRRVTAFAKAGLRKDWQMTTRHGGRLGERFLPLDRVGVYIPGGGAPLASTAIMTATLAKVAGVREIVACTPCGKDKSVNPVLLHALKIAGATEVYRIGGIQAIGMMAYGTQSVPAVQKIVGPGGAYVTAAKRQVYGHVALDLVAGPSEIAILADKTAKPAWVAADLLSQLEHGTGHEKALLVTDSAELAQGVSDQLAWQTPQLSRAARVTPMLEKGLLLVVVPTLDQGAELCNRFAPEHLELMVSRPRQFLPRLTAAGAIFVGHWTPESAGDFAAGPSHVLPTGGAARSFSGLTVDDFRRRTSIIEYARNDLRDALEIIETFGAIEGLDAHARAGTIRFEK